MLITAGNAQKNVHLPSNVTVWRRETWDIVKKKRNFRAEPTSDGNTVG